MTTSYLFKATFTKSGAATAPSPAPTIAVVSSADAILVAALTATTALANLPGTYIYSYSGADGLDPIGRFTTTDATMDQTTLDSYTSIETRDIITDIANLPQDGNGGSLTLTYTVNKAGGGVLEGATVKLYSDSARSTLVTTKTSNVLGQVTFNNLVAGTYYLTTTMSGYTDMLDSEVVS